MRLPRVRSTVRRMMVSVAVVTVVTWGGRVAARWHSRRNRAGHHAAPGVSIETASSSLLEFRRENGAFPGCGLARGWAENECDRAEWHSRLKDEYRRAALRPWLLLRVPALTQAQGRRRADSRRLLPLGRTPWSGSGRHPRPVVGMPGRSVVLDSTAGARGFENDA
jgi:hypothetical protein